jgi:hypothetical protein
MVEEQQTAPNSCETTANKTSADANDLLSLLVTAMADS